MYGVRVFLWLMVDSAHLAVLGNHDDVVVSSQRGLRLDELALKLK